MSGLKFIVLDRRLIDAIVVTRIQYENTYILRWLPRSLHAERAVFNLRENIEWVEDAIRGAEAVNVRGDVFGKESASERICEVLYNHIFSLNHLMNDIINELRITT